MPGFQLASFWEGNRAQLFATYVLSSVAAVVPVPREVDFGFDLMCTITRHEGRALYAGRAFGVQVKAASESEVRYGGLNARQEWKSYELEWLYGQDQPLLLCIVDLKQWRVRLYSTTRIWWVHYQGGPGEVVLAPDLDIEKFEGSSLSNRYRRDLLKPTRSGDKAGDGYSYRVPLGPPIVDVEVKEYEIEEVRQRLRECLDQWIGLDYRNIRHWHMRVPYSEEWDDWQPNFVPTMPVKILHYSNTMHDANIRPIMTSIGPAVAALMNNLKIQGQREKLSAVKPVARLARDYDALDPIGLALLEEMETMV